MGKLALVQTTGVTVTPVTTYASMSAVELDAVIQSQMAQCKKLYAGLVRHADSLYEALCAMELRFQKQERFRTDLRPLRAQSWYGYLESRGVKPSTFRQWRHRRLLSLMKPPVVAVTPDANTMAVELARELESKIFREKLGTVVQSRNRLNPTLTRRLINALKNSSEEMTAAAEKLSVDLPVFTSDKAHQRQVRERLSQLPEPELELKKKAGSSLANATVREISYRQARPMVLENEYLGSMGSARFCVGLFLRDPDTGKEFLGGVAIFGTTGGNRVAESICGKAHAHRVLVLVRGACCFWTSKNSGSFLLSRACSLMAERGYPIVCAFSDPSGGEVGILFQSANFLYVGQTSPTEQYEMNGKIRDARMVSGLTRDRRNGGLVYKRSRAEQKRILIQEGATFFKGVAKHKYIHIGGDKRVRRELKKALLLTPLQYPKRTPVIPA
jgi:hypothetical protein